MVRHPQWSYNLGIYEVNLRQYSEAGTFKEFEKRLPKLKEMGVGILWLMPIHPIGVIRRKGTLGSYYSVKNYLEVNPEYGTMDEFKMLVQKIHEMGMYVIIDWVANHTAWDNPLAVEHAEWYTRNEEGNFMPPVPDWGDVIDLNYEKAGLRRWMINAMKFWVEETDIDGFRCDVAEMVPMDLWAEARPELESIKPIFMLAEGNNPELHKKTFDMTYSWGLFHIMNGIARGKNTVADIDAYVEKEARTYGRDAYRMYFTSNHDENSWSGTVFERLGDGAAAFAVLTATINGMPLIYSGQEAGLNKRLSFFEKDPIEWKDHKFSGLYKTLLNLKKENNALWNGEQGGEIIRIPTTRDEVIFSFLRAKNEKRVFVILNLSPSEQTFTLKGDAFTGSYTNIFTDERVSFSAPVEMKLGAWDYRVLTK